jgi:hypothetical protein
MPDASAQLGNCGCVSFLAHLALRCKGKGGPSVLTNAIQEYRFDIVIKSGIPHSTTF